MEVEFRDYTVRPGHLDDWLAGWTAGVVPLRERCGFQIAGAWLDPEGHRFVWVLVYDGPGTFAAAGRRYHALPARTALDPEPSSFLDRARITRVTPVDLTSGRRV